MALFCQPGKWILFIYNNMQCIYMVGKRASRAAKGKAKIITIESATNQVDRNENLKTARPQTSPGKSNSLQNN
jgi:hypothetical protein